MPDLPTLLFLSIFFPTIAAAGYAVSSRNLVHSVLFLVITFIGVAMSFILLQAEFAATVQILIYVGAVSVLVLFAIMLTRHITGILTRTFVEKWWAGIGIALLTFLFLGMAVFDDTRFSVLPYVTDFVGNNRKTIEPIGIALMTDYALPFETLGVLLTVALVGAIVLTRRMDEKETKTKGESK